MVAVRARASSGLPVELRVLHGPAAGQGALKLSGRPGIVSVEAWWPGGRDFLAAPPVRQAFLVGKPAPAPPQDVWAYGPNTWPRRKSRDGGRLCGPGPGQVPPAAQPSQAVSWWA